MHLETVTRELYQFDELSDTAKEVARDWYKQTSEMYFNDDLECLYDDFANIARTLGIEIKTRECKTYGGRSVFVPCIYWSGFSSQGDGACFEGNYTYAKKAREKIKAYAPNDKKLHEIAESLFTLQKKHGYALSAVMTHSGHYYHSGCMTVDVSHARDFSLPDNTFNGIRQEMRCFADWMYSQLEKEYEYHQSNEYVDETIRINEYEFLKTGERA